MAFGIIGRTRSEECYGGLARANAQRAEAALGLREIGLPQIAALIESAIDRGLGTRAVGTQGKDVRRKVLSTLSTRGFSLFISRKRSVFQDATDRYLERMGQNK
jgi:hypothetical protein